MLDHRTAGARASKTARHRRALAIGLALAVLAVGACGDDDDETEASGAGTSSTTEAPEGGGGGDGEQASGDVEQFCEDLIEVQMMEPEIPEGATEEEETAINESFFQEEFLPAVQALDEVAPEEAREDGEAVTAFFEEHGDAVFQDPQLGMQFAEIEAPLNRTAAELCEAETVSVTGVEYAFEGAPAEVASGRVMFDFENAGQELHEMIVFKKKDGTTESFEEVLQLPEEEGQTKLEDVTFAFAAPGGSDTNLAELEPGDYALVCFIPVGLTLEVAQSGEEPQGPPHFTQGMLYEFAVS